MTADPASRPTPMRMLRGSLGLVAACVLLAGCADKFDHLGKAPSMSSVATPRESIDPSLPPTPLERQQSPLYPNMPPYKRSLVGPGPVQGYAPNPGAGIGPSLWNSGPTSLFGDRRARTVGDILTVLIEIQDKATLNNSTTRTRSGSDSVAAATVFGLEKVIDRIIPGDAVGLENGVSASGDSNSSGDGAIARDEKISLRIAATVVDVLPNGHLVVTGNQEVRVNFELRDLQVAGIIRPEDITRQNTITYDKMANARIMYGGRGQITDFQQPRLGQQIVDMISPF